MLGAALALGLAAALAERLVPLGEVRRFADEIAFASEGTSARYVITAGPGGYELFSDGQLVQSSLDEHRRSAALVRPALRAVARASRALLLYGGTGALEREILSDPRVLGLTVVAEDRELVRLSRSVTWLSTRAESAMGSPRLHLIIAEPLVWLKDHAREERYDLVVAGFPAPTGYREGKCYTRYSFGLLSARVAPGGAFVVPATSAFGSKSAFASVLSTIESLGLAASAYHAAIPTLGVASFVVGSRTPLPPRMLTSTPGVALDLGADLLPRPEAPISTLHGQHVVTAFEAERDRHGGSADTGE